MILPTLCIPGAEPLNTKHQKMKPQLGQLWFHFLMFRIQRYQGIERKFVGSASSHNGSYRKAGPTMEA